MGMAGLSTRNTWAPEACVQWAMGMAALLVKDSVNAASDAMGFTEALRHAFHIHELGHAHWAAHNENRYPVGLPPDVEDWRTGKPTQVARRDTP